MPAPNSSSGPLPAGCASLRRPLMSNVRRRVDPQRKTAAMNLLPLLSLGVLLVASIALGTDDSPRVIRKAAFPGAQKTVVVAEGDFEPRSVGSYSIRAYAGTDARFPYDDFIAGAVRPRDGTVEDVRFSDLDRDGLLDIVVVIRSAGSGGYLSADAFRLQGTTLTLLGSVSGLTRDADPVRALGAELRSRAEPRARSHR